MSSLVTENRPMVATFDALAKCIIPLSAPIKTLALAVTAAISLMLLE